MGGEGAASQTEIPVKFAKARQETGDEETYRLVGSDELDPKLNWISIDSPMARALVGKSIDDEVNVKTPAGDRCFIVVNIKY